MFKVWRALSRASCGAGFGRAVDWRRFSFVASNERQEYLRPGKEGDFVVFNVDTAARLNFNRLNISTMPGLKA